MLNIQMLDVPAVGIFLVIVGVVVVAYFLTEWWDERKRASAQEAPHPAGDGARGAKSGFDPIRLAEQVRSVRAVKFPKPKSPPKKKPAKRKKRK